jgi:hypothetical protein
MGVGFKKISHFNDNIACQCWGKKGQQNAYNKVG